MSNTESPWITHRQPTKEDASNMCVAVPNCVADAGWHSTAFDNIEQGKPWTHVPVLPPFIPDLVKKTLEQRVADIEAQLQQLRNK